MFYQCDGLILKEELGKLSACSLSILSIQKQEVPPFKDLWAYSLQLGQSLDIYHNANISFQYDPSWDGMDSI